MLEELNLFPVPVIKIKTKNWEQKKDKLLSLVDWDNPLYAYDDMVSDYYATHQSGTSYLSEFCDIMKDELDLLLDKADSLDSTLYIGALWAQRYKKSNYMAAHTHGAIGYSAVLYTEFDKTSHAGIRFLSSIHDEHGNPQNYTPEIDEGDLISFPSYLLHDVRHNTSDKNRTIFSFNYKVLKG